MLDFSKCSKKPTDADLAWLEPLEDLSSLDVSGAPITDAGLTHLKGLKRLDSLMLYGCPVTDAGMAHLEGLQDMRWLFLTNTLVTSQGVADLLRALPNAEIIFNSGKASVSVSSADRE